MEEMIRKMTSLPAQVYGLPQKGTLAVGKDADLCIFDAEKVMDHATFTEPTHRATGFPYVILAGRVIADHSVFSGEMAGKYISKK